MDDDISVSINFKSASSSAFSSTLIRVLFSELKVGVSSNDSMSFNSIFKVLLIDDLYCSMFFCKYPSVQTLFISSTSLDLFLELRFFNGNTSSSSLISELNDDTLFD
eukprot:NODE_70_length_23697_cov_0.294771.p12 type:complete len:107 gc:universal NODE_70_length_23697_cov_0.294771:6420-6100(-)